jgi:hypothetical protein
VGNLNLLSHIRYHEEYIQPQANTVGSAIRNRLPDQTHVLERLIQLDEAFFYQRFLMLGKEVGTRKLSCTVHGGTDPNRGHAASFLFQFVEPWSKLWTDGAGIYRNIGN